MQLKCYVLNIFYCVSLCGRLGELITRHRQESSLESDRLLSAKLQTEKLLEVRERAHRQHIKTLEEQVRTSLQMMAMYWFSDREKLYKTPSKFLAKIFSYVDWFEFQFK